MLLHKHNTLFPKIIVQFITLCYNIYKEDYYSYGNSGIIDLH